MKNQQSSTKYTFFSTMKNFVFILFVVFCGVVAPEVDAQKPECPSPFLIAPCTCDTDWGKGRLRCEYSPGVTQENVDRMFAAFREQNNLTGPNDWLDLESFTLADTLMTSLDLTPLLRTTMKYFTISYNTRLEGFTGPELTNETQGALSTGYAYIIYNALTSSGIGNSLKYFHPLNLTWIDLTSNNITELPQSENSSEFFPGLFAFKNLEVFDVSLNKIGLLRRGSFKELTRLRILDVSLNILMVLEEDCLIIDDPPPPEEGSEERRVLKVSLRMNDYTNNPDIYVGPKRIGLDKIRGRDVELDLTWSFIETLPKEEYYDFLMQNYEEQKNIVNVWNAGLGACDERMEWLKPLKDQLLNRVSPFPC